MHCESVICTDRQTDKSDYLTSTSSLYSLWWKQ